MSNPIALTGDALERAQFRAAACSSASTEPAVVVGQQRRARQNLRFLGNALRAATTANAKMEATIPERIDFPTFASTAGRGVSERTGAGETRREKRGAYDRDKDKRRRREASRDERRRKKRAKEKRKMSTLSADGEFSDGEEEGEIRE